MRLKEHEGVAARRDYFLFDPRLLKIDPAYNVRRMDDPELRAKNLELKESIRANGVKMPLEIRFNGTDAIVVAGHRRHAMVMELIGEGEPIKSVPVMQESAETNDEERTLNLVTSNSGEPLKPMEVAEVVRRLIAFGWDKGQIARRLGWKSTASVQQHLDLIAIPSEVKAAAKASGVADTTLRTAVKELGSAETLKLIQDNAAQGKKTRPKDVKQAAPKKATQAKAPPKPAEPEPTPEPPREEPAPSPAEQAPERQADEGTDPTKPDLLKPNGNDGVVSPTICCHALMAVSDSDAPEELCASWTQEQRDIAYDWAMRCALRASDNDDVVVPERPDFIPYVAPSPEAVEAYLALSNNMIAAAHEPKAVAQHDTPTPAKPNGAFFAALKPLQRALNNDVVWSEFSEGDQVGILLSYADATKLSAALNQAMGE